MRQAARFALVALVVLSAGCLTGGSDAGQTTEQPPYGTQFVSLQEVDRETAMDVPATKRAHFQNLSDGQQRVLTQALEEGQIQYGPDEEHPFDYSNESRIEYIRYEGQWYFVRVAIV